MFVAIFSLQSLKLHGASANGDSFNCALCGQVNHLSGQVNNLAHLKAEVVLVFVFVLVSVFLFSAPTL